LVRDRIVQLFYREVCPGIRKRLNFENEAQLNRSEKAKPTASPALKNRFFLFDLIRYGLQALAGRRQKRTTRRD
jgi:hypothetical protein